VSSQHDQILVHALHQARALRQLLQRQRGQMTAAPGLSPAQLAAGQSLLDEALDAAQQTLDKLQAIGDAVRDSTDPT